jgi:hypothetical protein
VTDNPSNPPRSAGEAHGIQVLYRTFLVVTAGCLIVLAVGIPLWYAEPLVPTGDGPAMPPPPIYLKIALTLVVITLWNAVVFRTYSRRKYTQVSRRRLAFAELLLIIPLAICVWLAVYVWSVIGVAAFGTVGLPLAVVGAVIAVDKSGGPTSAAAPPTSSSTRFSRRTLVVLAIAGLVIALLLLGWPQKLVVSLFAPDHATPSSTPALPSGTITGDFTHIPHEILAGERTPLGGPGDCVALSGPDRQQASVRAVPCEGPDAAYRIIQVARSAGECVGDADQRYYPSASSSSEQFALCLDFNWSTFSCIKMPEPQGWLSQRVGCEAPTNSERPEVVLVDVESANLCPHGGWAHPVRKFTVCTKSKS